MASLTACATTGTPHQAQAPLALAGAPAPGPAYPPRASLGRTLARALGPVVSRGNARVAVAVLGLDNSDQEIASYGRDATFDTASIIKVGILAAFLLQIQDEDRRLTAAEHRYAESMIQASDNHAAHILWRAIGKAEGLDTANERLGLSSTYGGPGMRWGLSQTTATDQVKLLRAIFAPGPGAPGRRSYEGLNEASRGYIQDLMSGIEEDQDWGVSAVGSQWALKNGWVRRTTTGLWVVNSVGQVTVHGRRYLVSVLSDGNASMEGGVSLVERAARAAIGAASAHVRPWPG
ncbi:serine hydrolase [Streptomyces sp. NPDC005931]|uniref:serine hydrolase n=1 Tax=Streptomyces sp. NPDC005931 TaxID=3364737 RepID=UPI0036ACADCC